MHRKKASKHSARTRNDYLPSLAATTMALCPQTRHRQYGVDARFAIRVTRTPDAFPIRIGVSRPTAVVKIETRDKRVAAASRTKRSTSRADAGGFGYGGPPETPIVRRAVCRLSRSENGSPR